MWGRGPEISWQAGQGNIKAQNRRLSGWSLALYILYTASLSMLLVYAAADMAADQLKLQLGKEQRGCIWVLGLEILLPLIWNEVTFTLRKTKLRWVGNLALLAIAFWGCLSHYHELAGELADGFYSMAQRYMDIWNRYYLTAYQLGRGSISREPLAWGLLLIAGTALLQMLSALLRKRVIMLLLPMTVLAAEMTVGLTPGWRGLACLSAAGLLSLYLDSNREFQIAPALLLAVLLGVGLSLTALVMTGPASRVNLLHERLQTFQHQVEQEIRDYDWQALWQKEGQVDNHSPEYEHKEMLTVKVNTLPQQTLYLRGYYGTDYQKGSWDTAEREFGRESLRHGLSGGSAAELLAGLSSSAYASLPGDRLRYELQYTGLRNRSAYLPYGADLQTVGESYKLSGDFIVEKARSLDSFSFTGWNPWLLSRDGSSIPDSDAERFYSWYNEFVQTQYLETPRDMLSLTELVRTIQADEEYRSAIKQLEAEDASQKNAARLYLGSLVAGRLRWRASYSLDPGDLPRGTDPIEYFLGESRKGYCVHFASAGVLILRQLGVPARYVSGYAVHTSEFASQGGSYVASVKDDDAHAWAEIWLDNVGWVPVEMTPGYEDTEVELPTQEEQSAFQPWEQETPPEIMDEQEEPEEENQGQEEPEEQEAPTPLPPDQEKDKEVDDKAGNSAVKPTGGASGVGAPGAAGGGEQPDTAGGWGFAGEGGWAVFGQNGSLRVSHVALAVLGIVAVVWICCKVIPPMLRRRVSWQDKIRADIEKGNARKVVKLINRRLYRRLWRKRAGMLVLRSDEEYLAALKQYYPQISGEEWESYLEVVRKAVYSREEVPAQEAGSCLRCLMRTKSKG